MALERGKLSDVVQVSAGTTVGIITVSSSKKVYVKSIMLNKRSDKTFANNALNHFNNAMILFGS